MGFGALRLGFLLNTLRRGRVIATIIPNFFMLKEDGDFLLLETGDKIIL